MKRKKFLNGKKYNENNRKIKKRKEKNILMEKRTEKN